MRPGIRTRPPQSTIRAPAPSGDSAGSTAAIVLPSTTTFKPRSSVSDLPSKSRALVNAIRETGAEGLAAVLPEPAANAPGVIGEWRENFRERRQFSRANAGVWQRHPARRGVSPSSGAHRNIRFSLDLRPCAAIGRSKPRLCRTGGPPQSDRGAREPGGQTVYAGVGASARINFSCLSSAQKSAGIRWRKAATFFST